MSDIFPVSVGQRRLIHLGRYGLIDHQLSVALRIEGRLARFESLEQILASVAMHHAMLRCRFERREGDYVQVIASTCCLDYIELTALGHEEVRDAYEAFRQEPIRLDHAPLWRFGVARTRGPTYLFFSIHHAIADGQSIDAFWRSFSTAAFERLEGEDRGFLDYCVNQASCLDSASVRGGIADIRQQFHGLQIRKWERSFPGLDVRIQVHDVKGVPTSVSAMSRSYGVSEFVLWLSAFIMAIHAATGESTIVVAVPTSNRAQQYENSIGYFNNVVLVPAMIGPGATPRSVVRDVGQAWLRTQRTATVPLDVVLESVPAARVGFGRYMLNYQAAHKGLDLRGSEIQGAGFQLPIRGIDADVFLSITRSEQRVSARILSRWKVRNDALRIVRELDRAVQSMVVYPDRVL